MTKFGPDFIYDNTKKVHTAECRCPICELKIECVCTNPVHGGKIWKCGTRECKLWKDLAHD